MHSLPQELIENIVWHADKDSRLNLLTVSRAFQASVERIHMACVHTLNSGSIKQFLSIYRGRRVRFLRSIVFHVNFPEVVDTDEDPLACRETAEDLKHNDELFTRQIFELFNALKTLSERETNVENQPRGLCLKINMNRQPDDGEMFCHHRRYHSWRLHLLKPEDLPTLPSIRALHFEPSTNFYLKGVRPVDLGVIPELAFKLPNLENLFCPHLYELFPHNYADAIWRHFTHPWEGPLRDSRHNFARVIENAQDDHAVGQHQHQRLPTKLNKVKLHFWAAVQSYSNMNQSKTLPDLIHPKPHDPLSSAIRIFSQGLSRLDLRTIADSTLFWRSSPSEPEPSWPNLKHLSVEFHPSTPKGTWYFAGPRREGINSVGFIIKEENYPPLVENQADEEWDDIWNDEGGRKENIEPNEFRVEPIPYVMEPLLESFARALARMPVLREAELFAYIGWWPREDIEEDYGEKNQPFVPSESLHRWGLRYLPACREEGRLKTRLEWQVGGWRPSESVMRLFRNVSGDGGGEDGLEVEWKEFVTGSGSSSYP